jgi:signal transduction histidine kinase
VWTHLIRNALQAMNYQGTLIINVKQKDNYLKIEIQDSGIGIDSDNTHKIFDAFFTTKTTAEGSGLGLYTVKKIIKKHAGEIKFKSQAGCTLFTVLLPID